MNIFFALIGRISEESLRVKYINYKNIITGYKAIALSLKKG